MSIRTTTAFVAGAVAAVVLAGGTTYAATGGNFILGRTNTAGVYSTLSNPNGTALVVKSKSGQPSLRVSDSAKVPSLNADRVDSIEGSSLVRTSTTLGTITSSGVIYDNETPENEADDLVAALAECPTGSQVMGGGADHEPEDSFLISSYPDTNPDFDTQAWVAISSAAPTQDNADEFTAFARCWDPSGNVEDNFARKAPSELSPSAERRMAGAPRDK
jgi:hypothetical protein